MVKKAANANAQDDKRLQGALKKLNMQPIAGVEEVNMFQNDGNVLHFAAPKGKLSFYDLALPLNPATDRLDYRIAQCTPPCQPIPWLSTALATSRSSRS